MGDESNKNTWLIRLSEVGRFWQIDFEQLTRPEQVFYCVWELEAEVNNGGFEQYFSNSSGDYSLAIVDALQEIGAHQAATIVGRAINLLEGGVPLPDETARHARLEGLTASAREELARLDQEFYLYPDNLTNLLYAYVRQHQSEIAGVEKIDR